MSGVGFGGLEPLCYLVGRKRRQNLGVHLFPAFCLFVPPGVKPSAWVPLAPAQLSMGHSYVLVGIDF